MFRVLGDLLVAQLSHPVGVTSAASASPPFDAQLRYAANSSMVLIVRLMIWIVLDMMMQAAISCMWEEAIRSVQTITTL
jgi:hypothetical protein